MAVAGRPQAALPSVDLVDDGEAVVPLRRERGPRLLPHLVAGAVAVAVALLASRPELIVLAVPFLAVPIAVLALADEPGIAVRLVELSPRLVEGDRLDVVVEVRADRPITVELGITAAGPLDDDPHAPPAVVLRAGPDPARWTYRPPTKHWGLVELSRVEVRAESASGLLRWAGAARLDRTVRLVPITPEGRRLLRVTEPRSTAGSHLTRQRGDGSEFADIRQLQPGDPLRSVNWKASARRGELMANQRHPERTADVVLVVDTSDDGSGYPSPSLLQAVRMAWVLGDVHLGRQDRVGVVLFGEGLRWVAPRGGQRGRDRLFETLLSVTAPGHRRLNRIEMLPPQVLPAGSTVVALTTLQSDAFARAIGTLRRQGHAVATVVIDPTDLLGPALAQVPPAAVRIWRADVEQRRRRLAARGIHTVSVPATAPPDAAVAALASRGRARALGS